MSNVRPLILVVAASAGRSAGSSAAFTSAMRFMKFWRTAKSPTLASNHGPFLPLPRKLGMLLMSPRWMLEVKVLEVAVFQAGDLVAQVPPSPATASR